MNKLNVFITSAGSSVLLITIMLIALSLYRKYRFRYLASYFYYYLCAFILSFYASINLDIIQLLFGDHAGLSQSWETLFYIIIFLALPFWFIADYMIIRFFREFMAKKLSARFTILYFSVLFSAYIASGIVLYAYTSIKKIAITDLVPYYEIFFIFIDFICWIIALSQVIVYRKTLKNKAKRKAAVMLFGIYVFVWISCFLTFFPIRGEGLYYTLRILYQSSVDFIPLLYLKSFLSKQYHLPIFSDEKHPDIFQLLSDFHVTKREAEIIELICDGKSNKEIADVLFISLQTVKDHIYSVFKKTDVKSRIQLANLVQEYLSPE